MIHQYIKDNFKHLLFYFIVLVILLVVSSLYGQLKEPIFYSLVLIGVIGFLFTSLDYMHYRRRITLLHRLAERPENAADNLPLTGNNEEFAYQQLIQALHESYQNYITTEEERYSDRSDYFAMWAHQIKTPIAAMHLLIDDKDMPQEKEQLFRIEEYVSMVMHYLKADDVSKDFVLAEYSLDSILEEAIRHYSRQFIQKKLKLNYTPSHLKICTDEKWFLFVTEQLLSNSLKYTQKGSISIYVKNETLIIEDTGIGIEAADLPRMFEKGYTGYNGRKDKKSTGLGLYLCRKVLDKMGNPIRIESQVGSGTKMLIGLGTCRNVS